MKKGIFVLSMFATFFSSEVIAQKNVSFGPIVGVNFSKLTGNQLYSDWKTGSTAGIFINYSGESRFGVNGQLLYSRMGGESPNGASKGHLDYLQIPIMGTYYLNGRGNKFRPKVMLGPYIGFLLKAVNENDVSINPEGATRPYKGVDGGAAMGAGFNYAIGRMVWLNADVRYNLGLTQVMNTVSDVHNRSWGINVGLSFPLGQYSPSTGTLR
ncbi:porin family protein [Runella aurantiaca]|uniref:PorT family protein n=1 Tax=Runella aurantiaca TaxID=2282308 RepID=A0A369I6C5_9BACT|nr:porin family protein [Runella aurantiaca]RDB05158.1 PorT family protein [Runella aurantiaca]